MPISMPALRTMGFDKPLRMKGVNAAAARVKRSEVKTTCGDNEGGEEEHVRLAAVEGS